MGKYGKKKYLVAGAAAVIVFAGAGAAYAYWSSTGTGTGSATTGTSTNLTVAVNSLTSANLTPGGPTDVVTFTATNPGTGSENVTGAVATVTSTSNGGCTSADFAITGTTIATGELAASAVANGSFSVQMIDRPVNQDACQNATVNFKVVVS